MGKIEIDAKLWLEMCRALGYAKGICDGAVLTLVSRDTLDVYEKIHLGTILGECGDKMKLVLDKIQEAKYD